MVEYRIDPEALTATLIWSYSQEGAFTRARGSAQRLSNGNTLIGWGSGVPITATEIDANRNKIWELTAQLNGEPTGSYRAFRDSR